MTSKQKQIKDRISCLKATRIFQENGGSLVCKKKKQDSGVDPFLYLNQSLSTRMETSNTILKESRKHKMLETGYENTIFKVPYTVMNGNLSQSRKGEKVPIMFIYRSNNDNSYNQLRKFLNSHS